MSRIKTLLCLIVFVVLGQTILAQTISLQGVLRDPLGRTVQDDYYKLTFAIYESPEGGDSLWSETYEGLQVNHGVYAVELGSMHSMSGLTFGVQYYVGISVQDGQELEPRLKLTNAPAAMAVLGVDNIFPSSGNIGVGTQTPEAGLHILPTANASGDQDLLLIANDDSDTVRVDSRGDMHLTGAIKFSDNSILNTAQGGSASALSAPDGVIAEIDNNNDGVGNFVVTRNSETIATLSNNGKLGLGIATPRSGFHGKLLKGIGGNHDYIGATFQFMDDASPSQNGMLLAGDNAQDDVWLALRATPFETEQWMLGARFFTDDKFHIGFGDRGTTMSYPAGTGSKFSIDTTGHIEIPGNLSVNEFINSPALKSVGNLILQADSDDSGSGHIRFKNGETTSLLIAHDGTLNNQGNFVINADSDNDGNGEIQFESGYATSLTISNNGDVYARGEVAMDGNLQVNGAGTVEGALEAAALTTNSFNISGDVKTTNNGGSSWLKPFRFKRYGMGDGEFITAWSAYPTSYTEQAFVINTGESATDWIAAVTGFESGYGDIEETGKQFLYQVSAYIENNTWKIKCQAPTESGAGDGPNWAIYVMFVSKKFGDMEADYGLEAYPPE